MGLHALSQDTIRLIKSTQVITTPGSIVKELLENSLDAGAKSISIKMVSKGKVVVVISVMFFAMKTYTSLEILTI